jgi:hypothetical protein
MKKYIVFFLFIISNVYCQNYNNEINFDSIDNYVQTIKYNGDISKLVSDLTKTCKTDLEKSRAIYFWITENISYDFKTFNKRKKNKSFKCKTKAECDLKIVQWKNKILNRVLNKKTAICSGYSELYKNMCNIAKIDCEVVAGYIKTEPNQIGKMGVLDHAWNVLIIDNKHYYLDLTWAAGSCSINKKGKLDKFYKNRNEYYWLTPIDKLSRNHFPKDTLQLVDSKFNKELFKKTPYIKNSILPDIDVVLPNSGIINTKICDTIQFEFEYSEEIENIQINTNIKKNPKVWIIENGIEIFNEKVIPKQKYIKFKKINKTYSFDYIVENKSIRYIEILFDYRLTIKYLVKITE